MDDVLISVIVPIFNTEVYLHRVVESIIAQTYRNLEIILVNDGSTDASGQTCDGLAQKDARIKVIHQKNAGVSAARNAGLEAASGEWVGFVDSDDWVEPDMYAKLVRVAIDNEKPIAVCGYTKHHLDGQVERRTLESLPGRITSNEAIGHILSGRYYEGFMVNKLFKRRLFNDKTPAYFDRKLHF